MASLLASLGASPIPAAPSPTIFERKMERLSNSLPTPRLPKKGVRAALKSERAIRFAELRDFGGTPASKVAGHNGRPAQANRAARRAATQRLRFV